MSILFGIYVGIAICVFIISGFVTVLGGRDKDIWKPFLVAPLWLIFLPIYMFKIKKRYDKW